MSICYDAPMITIEGEVKPIGYVFHTYFALKLDGKTIGSISGKGFDSVDCSEFELMILADRFHFDFNMLTQAHKANVINNQTPFLILEEMQIDLKCRGANLGIELIKQATKAFFDKLGKQASFLMHPCPIGWPDKETRDEGQKALSSYYAKHLPIKRINKSPYFYFTVDNQTAL